MGETLRSPETGGDQINGDTHRNHGKAFEDNKCSTASCRPYYDIEGVPLLEGIPGCQRDFKETCCMLHVAHGILPGILHLEYCCLE